MVKKKSIYPYLLVAPALIIILCVVFIPVINAIGMSFQSYDLRRPNDIAFVGLANYIAAFKDELFWKALWKTILWVVFGVGFQFVFGFILALLLNKKFRGRGVVRAVSLIPWVTPGILIGLGQMFVIFMGNKKYHYPKQDPMSFKDFLKLAIKCLPPVLTPVIIIGGVIGGLCTATESAAIACIYAIILGVFVFKNLSLKDVKPLLYDTLRTSATSLFALATANALGQLLSYYNVSTSVQQMFATYFPYKWQFLLAVIGFYLFLGTFMDAIPAMILFVPVLMPVATAFGITPVQLGLIIVITLAVGQVTPPYGLCLLIAGRISGMSVQKSFKAVIPYIMVSVVVVVLIAFLPDIAFALPKLIKPEWF